MKRVIATIIQDFFAGIIVGSTGERKSNHVITDFPRSKFAPGEYKNT
jgi:hypothetical protein